MKREVRQRELKSALLGLTRDFMRAYMQKHRSTCLEALADIWHTFGELLSAHSIRLEQIRESKNEAPREEPNFDDKPYLQLVVWSDVVATVTDERLEDQLVSFYKVLERVLEHRLVKTSLAELEVLYKRKSEPVRAAG